MKHRDTPAVTSLPQAPQDEVNGRVRQYIITISIRVVCFILMGVITPYGWYTWVFAFAAAILPYIAVVFANEGGTPSGPPVEAPAIALETAPPVREEAFDASASPQVITIHEVPRDEQR